MQIPMIDRMLLHGTIVSAFLAALVYGHDASAQTVPSAKTNRDSANASRTISVQESFVPAFSIEPLMQTIEGRAGDVIAFKFKVESANRNAKVEVEPIGLRQELNGQILHDANADQTDLIRLLTPNVMNLEANIPATIEGVVKIPRADSKHHSIGLIVRDVGTESDSTPSLKPDGTPRTQADIRFVTQYMLRLDLSVQGVRGESARELVVENVDMVPFEGRPQLQAVVLNPTETTFEFELSARLRSSPSDRSQKPIRLVMPIRKTVEDEGRYVGRILPKSRIRMEELLPEAIAGGNYEVEMQLTFDGQVVKRSTATIDIESSDYPAQDVLIGQVDDGLMVSPTQIELSKLRGGSRRVTMLLKNSSRETKSITLKPLSPSELEISSVMIQPTEVLLPPMGSRKVSLTLRSSSEQTSAAQYGVVRVEVTSSERDHAVSRDLPLAVMLADGPTPSITMAPIQWDPSIPYPGFRTRLENSGDAHLAVNSRLTIVDESGRRTVIPAGFGRWLMPGSSTPLEFRMPSPLMPGQYLLRCEVQRPGETLVSEQVFSVSDMETASPATN